LAAVGQVMRLPVFWAPPHPLTVWNNTFMPSITGTARAAALGLFASAVVLAATPPDSLYKTLREAPLADAFVVENIVLHRDVGVITLKSGTIAFTAPSMNRDSVAVFAGEGEFQLDPLMGIEKDYLKSLTEQESIKESFDRAMFCFTDETGKVIRSQAKTKVAETKLADILRDQRKRMRTPHAMENIEAAILADLYRAGQPGFFSAYLHGRKHNDLRFHVKPRGAVLQLSPEEVFVMSVEPPGVPDQYLYLTHLKSEFENGQASSGEDKRVVQAEDYKIATTIARNDHFTATTDLHYRTLAGGDRVIPLELLPTLRVTRVTHDGQEVPFIQEDKREDASFYVVLPQPLEKGSDHHLVIEYQGDKVVHKAGGGNFSVGARESWYPNVNSFKDHARYDLTFKVPKQYTLVSVGKLAKEWTEQDLACTQWTSETPMAVAGFNYGTFKKKLINDPQSGMTVEGYANAELPDYLREPEMNRSTGASGTMSPSALIEKTMSEAQIATRIFNQWFGKSEFSRVAITQQPEFSFGQSWPSLVYLPLSAYLDATQRWQLMGLQRGLTEFIDEVTAHEVSHQYWGHMVGWSTYHDQWLSEGFANFSAGLFLQLTNKSPEKYLQYWQHARERLLEKNNFGRRANDAGPLWMGLRLSSEKNPGAYSRVVYGKGGYILHMLRQMMHEQNEGDKYFIGMMQDFVAQHLNGNATTESFQKVVEKHMRPSMNLTANGKMDWFFSEWVYGTAIPRYKLDYTVTPEPDGKFLLKGSVTQSDVPQDFVMMAPIYLDFDGQMLRMGSARMTGNTTVPVEVHLPRKPKRVLLNAFHDVLEQ
jgi:hypothetical protein